MGNKMAKNGVVRHLSTFKIVWSEILNLGEGEAGKEDTKEEATTAKKSAIETRDELLVDMACFVMTHAYFDIVKKTKKVPELSASLSEDLDDTSRKQCQVRFNIR